MARAAKPQQLELTMPLTQVAALHEAHQQLLQELHYTYAERDVERALLRETQAALAAERLRNGELALIVQKYPYVLTENSGLRLENARLLGALAALAGERPSYAHPDLQGLLKELIRVAHPDHWESKPATELAHEITVRLVALRQEVGR